MFASRSSVRAAGALQSISSRIAIEPFVPVTYGSRQCLWRSHERWQASPGNVFSYGFSWRPSAHKPRVVGDFSSVIPPVRTKSDRPLEEETLPEYGPDDFYPIDPGTQINSRYRVIGKLGHGANSTVWLCRDLQDAEHVVAKVHVRSPPRSVNREKAAYEHLNNLSIAHPGCLHIRQTLDMFSLERSNGESHLCLINPPLQCTLLDLQKLGGPCQALPEGLVKLVMRSLLEALDSLHTEADMTHCDLKLSNIILGLEDAAVLTDYESRENQASRAMKVINEERTIYASRPFRQPRAHAYGHLVLCDFGEARTGAANAYAEIQPEIYKAPEILMQFEWGHALDIWNAACVSWDLLGAEHLFSGRGPGGFHNNRYHMNEIVSLIGRPPEAFLLRSPHTHRLFDADGNWKAEPPITMRSIEDRLQHLEVSDKTLLLSFLQGMLRWLPEERMTAQQLLQHSWLSETVQ